MASGRHYSHTEWFPFNRGWRCLMVPLIVLQRIISMKCNFFLLQVMAQQQLNQLEGRVERPWFRAAVFLPVDPRVMPEDILPTILGPEEQLLYRRRFLSIRTYQQESPHGLTSLYNFLLPDQDSLQQTRHHLDMIFQRQVTAFRLNAAVGAILGHRTTGQLRY